MTNRDSTPTRRATYNELNAEMYRKYPHLECWRRIKPPAVPIDQTSRDPAAATRRKRP